MNEWKYIRHFTPQEFASPDDPESGLLMDMTLVRMLDAIRERYGKPIKITSAVRSAEHNAKVGGVENSAHTRGRAVDVACPDSRLRMMLVTTAILRGIVRIGIGKDFVHLDTDDKLPQKVMWHYYGGQR